MDRTAQRIFRCLKERKMACEWGYFWLPKSGLSMRHMIILMNEKWGMVFLAVRSKVQSQASLSSFPFCLLHHSTDLRFAPLWSTNKQLSEPHSHRISSRGWFFFTNSFCLRKENFPENSLSRVLGPLIGLDYMTSLLVVNEARRTIFNL